MIDLVCAPLIYAMLALLIALHGILGIGIACLWLGLGFHLVSQTASRGILADLAFAADWPIWVLLERR